MESLEKYKEIQRKHLEELRKGLNLPDSLVKTILNIIENGKYID